MEMGRRLAITCFVATVASICLGLESDGKTSEKAFGASASNGVGAFDASPDGSRQFQAWRFGQSFPDVANAVNLQSWKEWMSKRSFGANGYDNLKFPNLATWKSWMDRKRNFNPEGSFTNIGQFDDGQFQRWSDWVSKRSLASNDHPFDNNPFERSFQGLNSQYWSDLAKRSYFGSNFHNIGSTNSKMQSWQDWVKRSVQENPDFKIPFGARTFFPPASSSDGSDKRQFNYSPPGFGSFRRYFTDGLQDWRNSFKASKRAKDSEKEQKN